MVLWAIWTTRNKTAIEGVMIRKPTDIFHKIFVCMQRWQAWLKCTDQAHQEHWTAQVRGWLMDFVKWIMDRPPGECDL
jgi:hypothetical protein